VGDTGMSGSEPDKGARSGLTSKVIYPVVVAVLAAVIIALLTGAFGKVKEWVFPTKVTVTGTVLIGKTGVPGVKLTLDGHPVEPTDEQGEFSINGVSEGSHKLVLRKLGAWPRKPIKFTVGKTDKKLGRLLLEPFVNVGFTYDEGSPAETVSYTAYVWLFGHPSAKKQIKSARYKLPDWTGKPPQEGASRAPFCSTVEGQVDFNTLGQQAGNPVFATVVLRNGRRLRVVGFPDPGGPHPTACQVGSTSGSSSSSTRGVVPYVIGQSLKRAKALLVSRGFTVSLSYTASSRPSGAVIHQSPQQGVRKQHGATVTLVVSKGSSGTHTPTVTVPKVIGQTLAGATANLQSRGFNVTHEPVDSDRPKGEVLDQNPEPGTSVPKGSTVKLTISNGPTQSIVPDVLDDTSQQAAQALAAAGFKVNKQYVSVSDLSQDNIVQSQNPDGGAKETKGSTVTITIGQYSP
jgi:beta-lactam-binding protein with PASTA domain